MPGIGETGTRAPCGVIVNSCCIGGRAKGLCRFAGYGACWLGENCGGALDMYTACGLEGSGECRPGGRGPGGDGQ